MMRQIFIVDAHIVDSNGTFGFLDGYPKKFDSKNYSDDIEKTRVRAEGDMCEVWGAMCKNDVRMLQTVSISTVDGFLIECKTRGTINPEEPEEEAEE